MPGEPRRRSSVPRGLFRSGIISLILVVILNIVVAAAAHPVHSGEPQPLALIILNISRRALRMLLRTGDSSDHPTVSWPGLLREHEREPADFTVPAIGNHLARP